MTKRVFNAEFGWFCALRDNYEKCFLSYVEDNEESICVFTTKKRADEYIADNKHTKDFISVKITWKDVLDIAISEGLNILIDEVCKVKINWVDNSEGDFCEDCKKCF